MKAKRYMRGISVILVILLVLQIAPVSVIASHIASEHPQTVQSIAEESSPITTELIDQRTSASKTYRREDGTLVEVYSGETLHYQDQEGNWEEIDNSLVQHINAHGDTVFTNKSNAMQVELPRTLHSDSPITIEKDKYRLSFYFVDLKEKITIDKVQNSFDTKESPKEQDKSDVNIPYKNSKVLYQNYFKNTDLEYQIYGQTLKENIIINKSSDYKKTYSFKIEAPEMIAQVNQTNTITFMNTEKQPIFILPSPYMSDANQTLSYDISVSLHQEGNGTYLLTYSPSEEWLTASERAYPVTIDPGVTTDTSTSNIDSFVVVNSNNSPSQSTLYPALINSKQPSTSASDSIFSKLYIKFPELNEQSQKGNIQKVTLSMFCHRFTGENTDQLQANMVTSKWNGNTLTYNNQPKYSSDIIDICNLKQEGQINLDITSAVKKWENGTSNEGIVLQLSDQEAIQWYLFYDQVGKVQSNSPQLIVEYYETTGIDDSWDYHSLSLGRAGNVSMNDFSQSITVQRPDIGLDGNIMPVQIQMTYNSPASEVISSLTGSGVSAFGSYWRTNYNQVLESTGDQIRFHDETGRALCFKKSNRTENGMIVYEETNSQNGLTLLTDKNGAKLKYPNGDTKIFDSDWRLSKIQDQYGKTIKIIYDDSLLITRNRILKIIDGVGRQYVFNYTSGKNFLYDRVNSIVCKDAAGKAITITDERGVQVPMQMQYQYDDNGCLTAVIYPDGKQITYTYNSNRYLTQMTDIDGSRILFSWNNWRLFKMQKQNINENGAYVTIDSLQAKMKGINYVTFLTQDGTEITKQFNRNGKTVCVFDQSGKPISPQYSKQIEQSEVKDNFLENGNFESGESSWSGSATIIDFGDTGNDGTYVAYFESEQDLNYDKAIHLSASKRDRIYTLSAKYLASGANFKIGIEPCDDSGTQIESLSSYSDPITTSDSMEWKKVSVTCSIPANTACSLKIKMINDVSDGNIILDDVELVEGKVEVYENLVSNGDFSTHFTTSTISVISYWTKNATKSQIKVTSCSQENRDEKLSLNTAQFTGQLTGISSLKQRVNIKGRAGDSYSIGAWAKAVSALPKSTDSSRVFSMAVFAPKESSTEMEQIAVYDFNPSVTCWQYGFKLFQLTRDCDYVDIYLSYNHQLNDAYFDGVQLYKEGHSDLSENTEQTERTCPCTECSQANCECNCANEDVCKCIQCKIGLRSKKDENGNITESRITDGTLSMISEYSYNATGNYQTSRTTENGNMIEYQYNEGNGLLEEIRDSQKGVFKNQFNAMKVLTGTTKAVSNLSNGTTMQSHYSYTNDKLTEITHNGASYRFDYDIFGNTKRVSLGTQPLMEYQYADGLKGRIGSLIYGNGQKVHYSYNDKNQVVGIRYNDEPSCRYTYEYNSSGGIISATDSKSNRLYKVIDGGYEILNANNGESIYSCEKYTSDKTYKRLFGLSLTEGFPDIPYNQDASLIGHKKTINIGTHNIDISSTTDRLNREQTVGTKIGNTLHLVTKKYRSDAEKTTTLISDYTNSIAGNNLPSFSYEYDDTGMMKKVYLQKLDGSGGTLLSSYDYDEAGQLVSETNKNVTTSYQYDVGGNLHTKISGKNVVAYEYNNSSWKDQLTSYNGKAIVYDAIGNPVSYDGWIFQWESGRTLSSLEKDQKSLKFLYDDNGLRNQKQIKDGESTTNIEYIWEGEKLAAEKIVKGGKTTTCIFMYDESDHLTGFVVDGTDAYFYIKNAQNDIVAIANSTGAIKVTYEYSAWGELLSHTGDSALYELNPFTYRSYQYDQETGLYYLQKRYYNPEWCRFINADHQIDINNIMSCNVYLYCGNDPVSNIDPNGACHINETEVLSNPLYYLLHTMGTIIDVIDIRSLNGFNYARNMLVELFTILLNGEKLLEPKYSDPVKLADWTMFQLLYSLATGADFGELDIDYVGPVLTIHIPDGIASIVNWVVHKGIEYLSKLILIAFQMETKITIEKTILGAILSYLFDQILDKSVKLGKENNIIIATKRYDLGYKYREDYFTIFFNSEGIWYISYKHNEYYKFR